MEKEKEVKRNDKNIKIIKYLFDLFCDFKFFK